MANTCTQLYIQFSFAVQNRKNLIRPQWEQSLHKYITGIVQNKSYKMIAINGMPDHIHMFIGYRPAESFSELVKVVKGESSKWITEQGDVNGRFSWQDGYGASSYSHSHIDRVYHYVINQKEHHQRKTFQEEYFELLNKFGVEYDERFIFKKVL